MNTDWSGPYYVVGNVPGNERISITTNPNFIPSRTIREHAHCTLYIWDEDGLPHTAPVVNGMVPADEDGNVFYRNGELATGNHGASYMALLYRGASTEGFYLRNCAEEPAEGVVALSTYRDDDQYIYYRVPITAPSSVDITTGPPPGQTPSSTPTPTPALTPTPQPGSDDCLASIGTPNGTVSRDGAWSSGCASANRSNRYARFYSFSLDQQADVQIDLTSATDTYLFLLQGSGTDGTIIERDDDGGPTGYDSRITQALSPGSYTIEATTYGSRRTGNFTLTLQVDGGSTQPTNTPTPTSIPTPTPRPTPAPTAASTPTPALTPTP